MTTLEALMQLFLNRSCWSRQIEVFSQFLATSKSHTLMLSRVSSRRCFKTRYEGKGGAAELGNDQGRSLLLKE
ncbi:hypothetical protein RRG08_023408 [Elysia crispata]|uniref:Uncharacterized protein n=1 Tax=Elysia crispata TaxID=231223 RepID=A0AAE1CWY6_9GAST|nr:hypothetical protein RRG08_023408 [Elysia crispata]